ncbi:hypothetical protein [Rhodomicrobium lacus]|uniref:hypothetical protein n=1 Tax=Rhodomicrobium lacus TaxID=2498452 RepID=UPI000F8F5FEE|nr:hypothetical protein [Rhodomicrobium lacus]
MAGWYRQGTASVSSGGTAVTGSATAWLAQVKPGDAITFDGGASWHEVATVADDTHLTLASSYAGTTVTSGAYAIMRTGPGWTLATDLALRLADFIDALAALPEPAGTGDAGKILRANAGGTALELAAVLPTPAGTGDAGKILRANAGGTALELAALGTAATHDVPSSGNATPEQAVLGSDTRLRNALNKFRNGSFAIAQRGTSGSVAAGATAYTLDGWQIAATGAAAAWSQVWNTGLAGSSLQINCASGLTACTLQQRIESYLSAALLTYALAAQPVTVQFAVYNGTSAAITPKIATGYASTRDNFGTVTADLAATNLQPIAAGATGVVSYTFVPNGNIANGLQIQLQFGAALNAASGYVRVGRADVRATPGIAAGLNGAPPLPEILDPSTEVQLARRYYQLVGLTFMSAGIATYGGCVIAAQIQMRASPTVLSTVSAYNGGPWTNPTTFATEITPNYFKAWPPSTQSSGAYNSVVFELSAEL